jgi:hypothetical protein
MQNPEVLSHMSQLLAMAGDLLATNPSPELRQLVSELVRNVQSTQPNIVNGALSVASQESQHCLQLSLQLNNGN